MIDQIVTLPIVPSGKEELFAYYRMQLLPDGFPGASPRSHPGQPAQPHPLYGVYLIRMSLADGRPELRQQAITAGHAAIDRMERRGDALIFQYEAESAFNNLGRRFYSALTQAKYASAFTMLHAETADDRFRIAAEQAIESLAIPLEEGGVMVRRPEGIAFEEAPCAVPSLILNGWISVLENLYRYAAAAKSKRAQELFASSISLLRHYLPLYDMPDFKNSRYALAGTSPFTLALPEGMQITSGDLITEQERVPFIEREPFRWNVSIDQRSGSVSGNLIFPIVGGASLSFRVASDRAGEARLSAPAMQYDPMRGIRYGEHVLLDTRPVIEGVSELRFDLPADHFQISAYPTNFRKKIAGKNYNVYHRMHIDGLRKLAEFTGDKLLLKYADRWDAYCEKWPKMAVYKKPGISTERYKG